VPVSGGAVGRVDGRQNALGLVEKSAIARQSAHHGSARTQGGRCRLPPSVASVAARVPAEAGRAWCCAVARQTNLNRAPEREAGGGSGWDVSAERLRLLKAGNLGEMGFHLDAVR
jgi:hypothetical protein